MIKDRMWDVGRGVKAAFCRHPIWRMGYAQGMPHLILLALILAVSGPARIAAQSTKEADAPVPKAYLPPAGMCRIWVDNVPAARQPAPTDCATAIRNKPPNARVIFPAGRQGEAKGLTPRQRPDTTKRKPPA